MTLLTKEMTKPNGIAFSPDEKTLYVSNSDPEKAVWMALEVKDDGTLGKGKVFYDATDFHKDLDEGHRGLPDGMKLDKDGNLFAAGPGGILVFTPEAKLLGVIATGVRHVQLQLGRRRLGAVHHREQEFDADQDEDEGQRILAKNRTQGPLAATPEESAGHTRFPPGSRLRLGQSLFRVLSLLLRVRRQRRDVLLLRLQLVLDHRDRLFELLVVAGVLLRRVVVHDDVGIDAVALDDPLLAVHVVARELRLRQVPPSTSGSEPRMPTTPPQLRLPISLPSLCARKRYGKRSPSDAENSFIRQTFGP